MGIGRRRRARRISRPRDRHVATVLSGQVFRREPTQRDFALVAKMLGDGVNGDWEKKARKAYFETPRSACGNGAERASLPAGANPARFCVGGEDAGGRGEWGLGEEGAQGVFRDPEIGMWQRC